MKKDVIYIDIEDDITAVIEKLKASKEKIIALVPPKGNAVLQSVVNLKLLRRAAETGNKQLVVVTGNQALIALAGGLGFYIAKNLQSKPTLIDAESISGVHDESVEVSDEVGALEPADESTNDQDEMELSAAELTSLDDDSSTDSKPVASGATAKSAKQSSKLKKAIPSFDAFRKKLLIGGGIALVLLILAVLVFGRAKATVVIRAETTPVEVQLQASLNANATQSDASTYALKGVVQETKRPLTQNFAATGQKDLGSKASGTMTIVNCSASDVSLAAGTSFTASGLNFISQTAVSVPRSGYNFTPGGFVCKNDGNTKVAVISEEAGDKYNLGGRSYQISGGPANVTATGSAMTGGTSNVVKVITQADIDKARELLNQQDTAAVKAELQKSFPKDVAILNDSFVTTLGGVSSTPAVGEQASEAKLTAEASYSLLGVSNKDLSAALGAFVATKMTNKNQQRVYDDGLENLKLEKVEATARTATYKLATTAQYGPQFDTDGLKQEVAGKKYGEVRSILQGLPGVKGVDIKLSPFWARNLPGAGRVQIELEVDKNTGG